ncbi:beta-N-acetylglucosaminidase [Corynebacterium minutissimum]|uniref:Beta-N-acetylhexosaminidase n=1 Tax=Corynebacterium minutissimum TaxID=38301 RepID=A0A376CX26_9CORY|nr:beta-N-acetylglucosaminidase [Corynebacterium minutissimum]QRP60413.1 beta-N-acetylglucosaminidase [Corynebacterium minutissimum]STC75702.1 beta-N-acetylhexosaminidase [Corynebacterium minutissimum]
MRLTTRLTAAASAVLAAGALLSACGNKETPEPSPATSPVASTDSEEPSSAAATSASEEVSETSSAEETTSAKDSESAPASESESNSDDADESESAEPSSASDGKFEASVDKAYAIFGGLVPEEIFEEFDRCDPNGVTDSFNCSGSKVGQFQFFKSKAKASQTTQVLTELRSSRVVEDSGNRVVGWSMLGNTAILTVVDNDEGLIMQQMISTDQDDPEERLKELGLV